MITEMEAEHLLLTTIRGLMDPDVQVTIGWTSRLWKDLGLDSLQQARLLITLSDALGIQFPAGNFQYSTVGILLQRVLILLHEAGKITGPD